MPDTMTREQLAASLADLGWGLSAFVPDQPRYIASKSGAPEKAAQTPELLVQRVASWESEQARLKVNRPVSVSIERTDR